MLNNASQWEDTRFIGYFCIHGTLSTATCSYEGNIRSRFHRDGETAKYTDARTCWITEVNIFEADMASDILWNFTLG